jgi:hypothetical protein
MVLAGLLVIGLSQWYGRALVQGLSPALAWLIPSLDERFTILDVAVFDEGGGEVLRVLANLSRPVKVGDQVREPFGYGAMPAGGFEVALTLGGVLQYVQLLLIAVLAWPAQRVREWGLRLLVAVPLCVLLWVLQWPLTVIAELSHSIQPELGPVSALMVWSRFLMGGGGAVLSLLAAAVAIVVGSAQR